MLTVTRHADRVDAKLLSDRILKKISAQLSEHLGFEKKHAQAGVTFISTRAMQSLNHDYRGKNKPTNVLSFPQFTPGELKKIKYTKHDAIYLGDVLLCKTVIVSEALKLKKPLNHHLIHLVVHGVLHLLGYDHIKNSQAHQMEALETAVLERLGISDPYILNAPPRSRKNNKQ